MIFLNVLLFLPLFWHIMLEFPDYKILVVYSFFFYYFCFNYSFNWLSHVYKLNETTGTLLILVMSNNGSTSHQLACIPLMLYKLAGTQLIRSSNYLRYGFKRIFCLLNYLAYNPFTQKWFSFGRLNQLVHS